MKKTVAMLVVVLAVASPLSAQYTRLLTGTAFVDEAAPRVAYNATTDEFFVVFLRNDGGAANPSVRVIEVQTDGAFVEKPLNLFNAFDTYAPAEIACNDSGWCVVVAHRENVGGTPGYYVATIDEDGNRVAGPTLLANGALDDQVAFDTGRFETLRSCQIAYNSLADEFLVSFAIIDTLDRSAIYTRRLSATGTPLGSSSIITATNPGGRTASHSLTYAPIADADNPSGRYLLIVNRAGFGTGGVYHLNSSGQVVGSGIVDGGYGDEFDSSGNGGDEKEFQAAYGVVDGIPQFRVVWLDEENEDRGCFGPPGTPLSATTFAASLDMDYQLISNDETPITSMCTLFDDYTRAPAIVFEPSAGTFQVVWREVGGASECNAFWARGMHIRTAEDTGSLAFSCSAINRPLSGLFPGTPATDDGPAQPSIAAAPDGMMLAVWDHPTLLSREIVGALFRNVPNDSVFDCQPIELGITPFDNFAVLDAPDTGDSCLGSDMFYRTYYCFTPSSSGTLIVSTCSPNTSFDTRLQVGILPSSAPIACAVGPGAEPGTECPANATSAALSLAVTAGETYWIAVGSELPSAPASGELTLSFTCDGDFAAVPDFAVGGIQPFFVAANDLDGDGQPELVIANSTGDVSVLLAQADGSYQLDQTVPVGDGPASVAIADLNGDTRPDLVTANSLSNDVSVLLAQPDGAFLLDQTAPVGGRPFSVAVADFNDDQRPDIVTANINSDDVSILLAQPDGAFLLAQTVTVGDQPASVAIADLNDDQRPDVVTANQSSDNVSVLLAQEDDALMLVQTVGVGDGPVSVAIADLNADGIPDLVTASFLADGVSVLLGNGDGTFAAAQAFPAGDGPRSIAIADQNGDTIPDIVTANQLSDEVSVQLGNGDGTFAVAQAFAVGDGPFSLAIADLNGDSVSDLVTANLYSEDMSVLLGLPDCNANGLADDCEVASGLVADINGNGIPDGCDPDCDGDGLPDDYEIGAGPPIWDESFPGDALSSGRWSVTLDNALGYTGGEIDGGLEVSDIVVDQIGEDGMYANVLFERAVPPTGDFVLDTVISWDQDDMITAMDVISIRPRSGSLLLADVGFLDGWLGSRGQLYFSGAGFGEGTGFDSQPYADTVRLTIARVGTTMTFFKDGAIVGVGPQASTLPLDNVQLLFRWFALPDAPPRPPSTIGTLRVESVRVGNPSALDCNADGVPDSCEPDTDGDGLIDNCDLCAAGAGSFDVDADGLVGLHDFRRFVRCAAGPGQGLAPGCECFDIDVDADTDLADFAELQVNFTGD